jgi:hypothetical protein
MSRRQKFDVRRLLSGNRAIVNVEGLCRLVHMPSGRIYEELVTPSTAKIVCKTYNGCFRKNTIHTDRMVAIGYDEIFAANAKLMKRRKRRKSR